MHGRRASLDNAALTKQTNDQLSRKQELLRTNICNSITMSWTKPKSSSQITRNKTKTAGMATTSTEIASTSLSEETFQNEPESAHRSGHRRIRADSPTPGGGAFVVQTSKCTSSSGRLQKKNFRNASLLSISHLPPGFLEQDVLKDRPVELPQLPARPGEHGGRPRLAVHERQVSETRLDLVGWLVHVHGRTWKQKNNT